MTEPNICKKCGNTINPGNTYCPICGVELKESHTLSIVLGYIFCILGGWIGLIFAIYNMSRNDEQTRKHGKIQMGILLIAIIITLIIYFTKY